MIKIILHFYNIKLLSNFYLHLHEIKFSYLHKNLVTLEAGYFANLLILLIIYFSNTISLYNSVY